MNLQLRNNFSFILFSNNKVFRKISFYWQQNKNKMSLVFFGIEWENFASFLIFLNILLIQISFWNLEWLLIVICRIFWRLTIVRSFSSFDWENRILTDGRTDGRTDGQTDGQTEFLGDLNTYFHFFNFSNKKKESRLKSDIPDPYTFPDRRLRSQECWPLHHLRTL